MGSLPIYITITPLGHVKLATLHWFSPQTIASKARRVTSASTMVLFTLSNSSLLIDMHRPILSLRDMFQKCNLKVWILAEMLTVKCTDNDVIDVIQWHDIFAILESLLDPDDACPTIRGYANFRTERKKKCKARRNPGGIIIYCRKEIIKGLTKIKSASQDILWLKLDRSYFGLPQDTYICVAYLVPESSEYAKKKDIFQEFQNEIDYYVSLGNIAVIGDLNARVGHKQETLVSVDTGGEVPLHSITNKSRVTNRLSEDTAVNSRGRQLLQLMTNHDLLIVNGRVCGDMRGRYTCCQWNGSSVVDMLLIHTKWNPVPNQLFQCRWYWVVYWSCGLYICRPHSRCS